MPKKEGVINFKYINTKKYCVDFKYNNLIFLKKIRDVFLQMISMLSIKIYPI